MYNEWMSNKINQNILADNLLHCDYKPYGSQCYSVARIFIQNGQKPLTLEN